MNLHDPLLRIVWEEVGGPRVEQPQRQGFGDVVLTKVVPGTLQGQASLEFKSQGVKWELLVRSKSVVA